MTHQETILIVEDDAALRMSLTLLLRAQGFRILTAKDGEEGLAMAFAEQPDLVLLDIMMPKMNGFEVCEEIRRKNADVPVLVLTAKGEAEDRVRGLRLGADDYISKPFNPEELVARVHAALRRQRKAAVQNTSVEFGDVYIHFGDQIAKRAGAVVQATTLELKLMKYLSESEGRVVTRQQVIDAVWGADYFGTERTVDNFINRLRAKFDDAEHPRHFLTVRGMGYRFSRAGGS